VKVAVKIYVPAPHTVLVVTGVSDSVVYAKVPGTIFPLNVAVASSWMLLNAVP
jgi:heme/copper-type cytochrome/quinol oxidase subunit 4